MRERKKGENVRRPIVASLFALIFLAYWQNRGPATALAVARPRPS